MRVLVSVFLLLLLSCCTTDYSKDIVGWWVSEDANKNNYVYYIIRDDGTYKKRMKGDFMGVDFDGTDRGTWKVKGSQIFFDVHTYNNKEQHGRKAVFRIKSLKQNKLVLETDEGTQFIYISADHQE